MSTLTINARHRKAYKAGNRTPENANCYGSVFGGRRTRSRRDWLRSVELEDAIDRRNIERKQAEARRRNLAALQAQKQNTEATNGKKGFLARGMAWLRRVAKVA